MPRTAWTSQAEGNGVCPFRPRGGLCQSSARDAKSLPPAGRFTSQLSMRCYELVHCVAFSLACASFEEGLAASRPSPRSTTSPRLTSSPPCCPWGSCRKGNWRQSRSQSGCNSYCLLLSLEELVSYCCLFTCPQGSKCPRNWRQSRLPSLLE